MRIVVLAGGIGGARFLRGLKRAAPDSEITVIGNTGDDISLFGLRVCPDLDTVMYTLGDGINEEQGWGRRDESFTVKEELLAYGVGPSWFGLGDRDFATHIVRTQMLSAGYPLSAVTEALCDRWQPGVRLIPMTDDQVETHVVVTDESGRRAIHFQEWWVRLRASVPAETIALVGAEDAKPAPGVLEALEEADTVVVCPSNPVVSIGPILAVPGVRDTLRARRERVVGVSPIIAGAPVKGPADRLMDPLGMEVSCVGVARAYRDFCSTLVIDAGDASRATEVDALGVHAVVTDTLMRDARVAAALARNALDAVA